MNKINIWIFAAIIGLIAAVLGNAWFQRERSVPISVENNAVQTFFADKLVDLQGKTIELSQYRGKPLVVNFWASWCPPCRAEHPTLTELSKRLPVYGVDLKDNEADALRFLSQDGNPFAAISTDPRGRTAIDWGVTAPPETFIIDGQGKILYRHAGPLVREDYTNRFLPQLEKALAQ